MASTYTNIPNGAGASAPEFDNGNSGAALTVDFSRGAAQKITLTANCTLTLTSASKGSAYVLNLVQDGTGGRTVTWPASVKWPGGTGPTLSAANKADLVTLYYNGTNFLGNSALNF
jgi:hypothetical protein